MTTNSFPPLKPEVSVSYSSCRVNAQVDENKRNTTVFGNTDLLTRRKETAAIRELWKSLKCPKNVAARCFNSVQLLNYPKNRNFRKVNSESSSVLCRHRKQHRVDNYCEVRHCQSAPLPTAPSVSLLTHRHTNRHTNSHTTVRDFSNVQTPPKTLIEVLPHINEPSSDSRSPTRKEYPDWNNDVCKKVPKRPEFSVPVVLTSINPAVSTIPKVRMNIASFYENIGIKTSRKLKEYDIDPTWSSKSCLTT